MDIIEFFNAEIDCIDKIDIRNGYYMRDLLGYDDYEIVTLPKVTLDESFMRALNSFDMYKDVALLDYLFENKTYYDYYYKEGIEPYYFITDMNLGENSQMVPTITYPRELDKASYAFFGHEFNHCIKDLNLDERRIRDRVSEVIPMFHELLCSDCEINEVVSKEIKKRRLILLKQDKDSGYEDANQIQYFNSFYYALALYNMYRNDENKILILRLISRVLKGEINSLDLLSMLDLYGMDLDYKVSWELEKMKEYVRK
ncbi:MAG: hypothetical protein IK137_02495 [Bacilli bacterium]|nr:hypothetical protein [Bacilli bacterium]